MRADTLRPACWRKPNRAELLVWLDSRKSGARPANGSQLFVRKNLRQIDVYTYLRARFGNPNGIQTYFRKNDSDNLVHWDYVLMAGDRYVYISGASRHMHFIIEENLSDDEWFILIDAFRAEFARCSKEKQDVLKGLEKFEIFPNKFKLIADECARSHEYLLESDSLMMPVSRLVDKESVEEFESATKHNSKIYAETYGHSLKLRLMTPVMAEAFINMLIIIFCKDSIRLNDIQYEAFIRSHIPERLKLLSINCVGFMGSVDVESSSYRQFLRVMNERNYFIHGNVNPLRDRIETVYFEGKHPIFVDGGDVMDKVFENADRVYGPKRVIADYEAVHLMLIDLVNLLDERSKSFFLQVIGDAHPGYEVRLKRVTRVLPDHTVSLMMPGMRFDDELVKSS